VRWERIPYGKYRIRVQTPGFGTAWQDVTVAQPETVVRVEVRLAPECGPLETSIGGTIRHNVPDRLWVKAVPIRGAGGVERRVTPTGHFLLSGLPQTDYFLLVLDGDRILHQRVVRGERSRGRTLSLAIDLRDTRN